MKAAIARLEISLETLTTNEPIHRAEGNIEQADMEKANIAEIKQALELLKAADTAQPSQESCPHLRISAKRENVKGDSQSPDQ